MRSRKALWLLFLAALTCSCQTNELTAPAPKKKIGSIGEVKINSKSDFEYGVGPLFSTPWEPARNLTTAEKVTLGRHLFYDKNLSKNRSQSCATCHQQERAFTDGLKRSVGSTGELHPRGAMSLANVGYAASLSWANPLLIELESQALLPLFGENPVEMGLKSWAEAEERIQERPIYAQLFKAAFPEETEQGIVPQITDALAAFQRTLLSNNSTYDRYLLGEAEISSAALLGAELFSSEKFECFHCHAEPYFTDHFHYENKRSYQALYHNTGLYNLEQGDYPLENTGVFEVTGNQQDMGRFKAPTLRNIAVTAPYMHDGSISTLEGVLDHYAAGGRTIESGERKGVGSESPYLSELVRPIEMSASEREQLLAFLSSLTDEEFLSNPELGNPWP